MFLPAATYALGDTLQIRSSNIVLQGAGTGSVLKATFPDGNVIYAGQPTPSSPQTINVQFRNFAIVASVVKSSGAAIFCERAQRFIMEDVKASAQEAQNNLYDGFYFQLFDTCVISNCQIVHRHAGVTANGQPNQAFGAGLWIIGGSRIIANDTPGSIGVHLGGSTGGIAIEDTDIIVNETGVLLDDTLSGATNREVFLNQCFVDSSANYGVDVMPGGVAVLHFNNTWLASSGRPNTKGFPDGANIHVRKGGITNVPSVIVDGCRVFNAFGSGIEAYSGAWTITGSDIEFNGLGDNGGYGILLGDPSVSNVVISGNNIRHNGTPAGQKPRTLGEGIHVARGVNDYIITSNIVRQNASAQIVDEGGPDRIVKNNLTRKNRS